MAKLARALSEYFIAAFWHRWFGIVLAILGVISVVEWFVGKAVLIPLWAKISVAVIALIVAPFLAWRELYNNHTDLQNRYRALQQQPSARTPITRVWQDRMDKVAEFMKRGRSIQIQVPKGEAPMVLIGDWITRVRIWIEETHAFLSRECTSQAEAEFLNDAGTKDVISPGVSAKAQRPLVTLNRRLENLSKIMGNPDVYL